MEAVSRGCRAGKRSVLLHNDVSCGVYHSVLHRHGQGARGGGGARCGWLIGACEERADQWRVLRILGWKLEEDMAERGVRKSNMRIKHLTDCVLAWPDGSGVLEQRERRLGCAQRERSKTSGRKCEAEEDSM